MVNKQERQESLFSPETTWAAVANVVHSCYIKKGQWTAEELGIPQNLPNIDQLKANGKFKIHSTTDIQADGSAASVMQATVNGERQIHISIASLYPGNPQLGKLADPKDAERMKHIGSAPGPFEGGRVMRGWNEVLDAHEPGKPSLWQQIEKTAEKAKHDHPDAKINFSGFSMGGPVAQVAASRWLASGHDIDGVFAFASPRVGNSEHERQFEKALHRIGKDEIPAYTVGRHDDMLSRVPPLAESGVPGRVYFDPKGHAEFSPSHVKENLDFMHGMITGGLKHFAHGHEPAGYLTTLSEMSSNADKNASALKALHQARDVMAGIEKNPHISEQQLADQWSKAASFLGKSKLMEIDGTDTKLHTKFDHQKAAHNIRDAIEVLHNRIISGDEKTAAKMEAQIRKDMEYGVRATVIDHSQASKPTPDHHTR